jgi:predicted transglutaminase-like cysteine proteinase
MKYLNTVFVIIVGCVVMLSGCDILSPTVSLQTTTTYSPSPSVPANQNTVIATTSANSSPIEPSQTQVVSPTFTPSPTTRKTPTTTPLETPNPTANPPKVTEQIPTPSPKIQLSEISEVSPSVESIPRDYKWDFELKQWTWSMQIPEAAYDYYKSLPRSPTDDYSIYVTHPLDDTLINSLADEIRGNAQKEGYNEYETVSFAIAFVQSLPYASDSVATGYDEYPRYPIETLVDDGGDCEDTSILAASLIEALGYGVVLLVFPETAESEGHCAVGVAGGEDVYGTFWKYGGKNYYYLETTGEGWEIGDIPEEYQQASAHIYPMIPIPILTHSWTVEPNGDFIQLEVTVENLGSAEAEGVYVYAGFDASNDRCWNRQISPVFQLGVNESITATLNLLPPYGKYTRIVVQIVYDGYAVDNSYSKWFDL